MGSYNTCSFDLTTLNNHYTQEDLDKVMTLFKNKLNTSNVDSFIKDEIFNDHIFDLTDGIITIYNDVENMRYNENESFIIGLTLLIDCFRELNIELQIPDMDKQPNWINDWGAGDAWLYRFDVYKNDDDNLIYIDYEGETIDMTNEWYGDQDYDED